MRDELRLWRRHLKSCPLSGRAERKCSCPIWCDGSLGGRRVRQSLGTTNWDRAERRVSKMVDPGFIDRSITATDACAEYLDDCRARGLKKTTIQSYTKTLDCLKDFLEHGHYATLSMIGLDVLTAFRASRIGTMKPSTLRKELKCLRAFCAFAMERGWITKNFAKQMKQPKGAAPVTLPFTPEEAEAILAACDHIGNREAPRVLWARKRARAFVLLLLYSGLRISDAAGLEKRRLDPDGRLILRQAKTGDAVSVKLPAGLVSELKSLDNPGPYFFRTGKEQLVTRTNRMRGVIASVLAKAKIKGHPHRFRDTFAVRLLEQDVPIRTVQILLGHKSVVTTEKHYAPYVKSQQRLLDAAVEKLPSLAPPKVPPKSEVAELALQKAAGNS